MRFSKSTVAYLFTYGLLSFGMFIGHRQFAPFHVLDFVELLFFRSVLWHRPVRTDRWEASG